MAIGRAVIKISKYVLIDRYKNQKLLIWENGMWKNLKKIAVVLIKDFLKQSFIYDRHAVFFSLLFHFMASLIHTRAARHNSCHMQQKKDKKLKFCTASNTGRQKIHQKIRQYFLTTVFVAAQNASLLPQASRSIIRSDQGSLRSELRSERHTYFICFTPNDNGIKRGRQHSTQTSWQKTHFHHPWWRWDFRNLLTCALL